MLHQYFQKKAVAKYLKTLPSVLQADYGGGNYYSFGQINTVVSKCNLPIKHMKFAIAAFTNPSDIAGIFSKYFPTENGLATRAQIADWFFDGDIEFVAKNSPLSKVGNSGNDSMPGGVQ